MEQLKPIVYTSEVMVTNEHLDELNHVNNVHYLHFLQEIATAHWHTAANQSTIDQVRWVVRKHEIEYLKPAKLGDKLTISTWIESYTPVTSTRRYEIKIAEQLIVTATTIWICLNAQSMRVHRLDKSSVAGFFE